MKIKLLTIILSIIITFNIVYANDSIVGITKYGNDKIEEVLNLSIPSNWEWMDLRPEIGYLDYYDINIGKVEKKYSGLTSRHYTYNNGTSQSLNINNQILRFKNYISDPFFIDHIVYSIYSKLNSDSIKSEFLTEAGLNTFKYSYPSNTIKEDTELEYNNIFKSYLYSKLYINRFLKSQFSFSDNVNKVNFYNYFSNNYLNFLDKNNERFQLTDKQLFDYLAFLSVIGTEHVTNHNLLIINNKVGEYKFIPIDLTPNFNKVTNIIPYSKNIFFELALKNPNYLNEYLTRVNYYNKNIIENGLLLNEISKYSCNSENFNLFIKDIYKKTHYFGKGFDDFKKSFDITNLDLQNYCKTIDTFKKAPEILGSNIKNALINSNYNYTTYQNKIYINTTSNIGVRIIDIKYDGKSILDKITLFNPPFFNKNNFIFPNITRGKEIGYLQNEFIPHPYNYIYIVNGMDISDISKLEIIAENAVTGENVKGIQTENNFVESIITDNKNYTFNIEYKNIIHNDLLLNDIKLGKAKIILESNCKVGNQELNKFKIDCSDIDLEKWPYPLYVKATFYEGEKIYFETGDEFFIDYKIPSVGKGLSQEKLSSYLVKTKKEPFINTITSYLKENKYNFDEAFSNKLKKIQSIYVLDGDIEVKKDIEFPKNSLVFIKPGTKINIYPLARIKFDAVLSLGNKANTVEFKNINKLPGWDRVEINKIGIFKNTNFTYSSSTKGALIFDDFSYGIFDQVRLEKHKDGINGKNTWLYTNKLSIIEGGKDYRPANGINISDSKIYSKSLFCDFTINCVQLRESIGNFEDTRANNVLRKVFNIEGTYNDIQINNLEVDGGEHHTSFAIWKRYNPKVNITGKTIFNNVNKDILDYDNYGIYDDYINKGVPSFLNEYANIFKKISKNEVTFLSNDVSVSSDIIIPKSIKLVIQAGTTIKLSKGVSILSYGEIVAKGTEQKKIQFISSKQNESWGVIALLGNNAKGDFSFCYFDDGGVDYLMGYDFSGMLSAHYAKNIIVTDSLFTHAQGDDSLHVLQTPFTIRGNEFIGNSSDSIDIDFSIAKYESIIEKNIFKNTGNDSIDLSGVRNVFVKSNKMYNSGDKGVSIGENSIATIDGNYFEGNNIGIESKDLSTPTVINNTFVKNKLVFSLYQKKMSYGPAKIFEKNNTLKENTENLKVEKYSQIIEN